MTKLPYCTFILIGILLTSCSTSEYKAKSNICSDERLNESDTTIINYILTKDVPLEAVTALKKVAKISDSEEKELLNQVYNTFTNKSFLTIKEMVEEFGKSLKLSLESENEETLKVLIVIRESDQFLSTMSTDGIGALQNIEGTCLNSVLSKINKSYKAVENSADDFARQLMQTGTREALLGIYIVNGEGVETQINIPIGLGIYSGPWGGGE